MSSVNHIRPRLAPAPERALVVRDFGKASSSRPITAPHQVPTNRGRHFPTRVGCKTCRSRNVVCDGRQPQCYQCLNSGLLCDNYVSPEPMKIEVLTNNRERRALQFFRENTAPRLSGHYDKDFWRNVVLQVSFTNVSLRHLLAGIGALHESLDLRSQNVPQESQAQVQYRLSLQQCNKAIQLLSKSSHNNATTTIILMSCILFITYESCQNGIEAAIQHLASGLKLLHNWKGTKAAAAISDSEADLINEHLYPLISRLGNQINVTSKQYGELSKAVRPRLMRSATAAMATEIASLAHAGNLLETILHEIVAVIEAPAPKPDHEALTKIVLQYMHLLVKWYSIFSIFVGKQTNNKDPFFPQEVIILQLRYWTATIILAAMPFMNEMLFDNHNHAFKNIIILCREFHQLEHGQSTAREGKLNLGFDNTIIMPLWMTGCCCRDPIIRREAIDLMYEIRRQEGIWGSEICAVTARQVMMIEEEGLTVRTSADIPLDRRIRLLTVDHEPMGFSTTSGSSSTQQDLQYPCFIHAWYRPLDAAPGQTVAIHQTRTWFKGYVPLPDPRSRSPSVTGSVLSGTSSNDEMITLHIHDPGDFPWRISFPYDFDHCLMMQWAVAHFEVD